MLRYCVQCRLILSGRVGFLYMNYSLCLGTVSSCTAWSLVMQNPQTSVLWLFLLSEKRLRTFFSPFSQCIYLTRNLGPGDARSSTKDSTRMSWDFWELSGCQLLGTTYFHAKEMYIWQEQDKAKLLFSSISTDWRKNKALNLCR